MSGTGPQGAVTINDVEHAAAAKPAAPKPVAQPGTKPTAADRAQQMRKSIAAAMSRSKREIPHYYLAEEIMLEKSLSWLTTRNAQRSIDERVLPALLPAFDLDRRLGGLDDRHDLAAGDLVPGLDQPLVQGAFIHVGAERGHLEFDHDRSPNRVCTAATMAGVWGRAASSRCLA
ncbi:hypothetical protein A9X02_00095 [Mycobacterium malmoense]|nr:hypothetical protein A9X02_00095 [Mycobacterium malmoense]